VNLLEHEYEDNVLRTKMRDRRRKWVVGGAQIGATAAFGVWLHAETGNDLGDARGFGRGSGRRHRRSLRWTRALRKTLSRLRGWTPLSNQTVGGMT